MSKPNKGEESSWEKLIKKEKICPLSLFYSVEISSDSSLTSSPFVKEVFCVSRARDD